VSLIYERMSAERKQAQNEGRYPEWFTTGGYQMFKEKYLYEADGFTAQTRRIAEEMASHAPSFLPEDHPMFDRIVESYGDNWADAFHSAIMQGHLALSTPLLANGGTDRALPVSCSGGVVEDSVDGFYKARHEAAMLTKNGFGTSAYLGGIRHRGATINTGGKASGSYVVARGFQQDAREVSQGGVRRGSWAGYIDLDHPDFDEWADDLLREPSGKNIGWNISRDFLRRLDEGDEEADRRYKRMMFIRALFGKGYIWKIDHANEQNPPMYVDRRLTVKASNLCTEIALFADEEHTFTCVLSSLNALHYEKWKDTGLAFLGLVFLDCVVESFLVRARKIPGLEKAVRFTEKSRALGLGLLGLHSYFQSKMIAFDSMEAFFENGILFKHIDDETQMATEWMAKEWGEPEWCKGYGVRNTHRMAVAPNMSSATICGQVSQGIEPWLANAFIQNTPSGDMQRINPAFLKLAQERGMASEELWDDINEHNGSVQHLDWLSDDEKAVFKTAFEINQEMIVRMASNRQRYIDQGQSLNLFFSTEASEAYVSRIHEMALRDDYIKGLYYVRTMAGVKAAKETECVACEG